jgi:hypothetical protein
MRGVISNLDVEMVLMLRMLTKMLLPTSRRSRWR